MTTVNRFAPRRRGQGQRVHRRSAIRRSGLISVWALGACLALPSLAASPLLETVKQNPQIARNLCGELRDLNAKGVSATSPQAVALVANRQGLNSTDAEILTTYVVGLHCPDVR